MYACLTPSRPSPGARVAFLVGDSHAGSIKNGIERAVQSDMTLAWVGITGNTCGLLHSATNGNSAICAEVKAIIEERLAANVMAGDLVAVSHAGYKYYYTEHQQAQIALLRSVYTTILQPRGANLVIMGDPPRLPRWAIYCLNAVANCYTSSVTNTDQNAMLAPLANEFPGVLYVEIFHLFCDSQRCMAQVPGTSTFAFFDDSHLTTAGGLYLWPYLCAAFQAAGFITA